MRRQITTLALAGLFAGFLLSSDASACHKKKKCATPCETVVAAPVCAPAPAPVVCEAPAKKCCFKMPKMKMPKMGCHKKAAACETVAYAPTYAPTVYAAPQSPVYAAPQATGQGM